MSQLDINGHEILDQTPISIPVQFERPTPLHIRIRNQILQMMHEQAESEENESFEDADDFDVEEDPVPSSPYEMEDDFDHIYDKHWIAENPSNTVQDKVTSSGSSSTDEDENEEPL